MAQPQAYLSAVPVHEPLIIERPTEIKHEALDGRGLIYAMAGDSPDHSTICFNLAAATGSQIKTKGYRGFSGNVKVSLGNGDLYAYPDLAIVCGEPKFHEQHSNVLLNPTVIFEVLSPLTEAYDRGEKFRRYRSEIKSLQEYVMVSQDRVHFEQYSRLLDDAWRLEDITDPKAELLVSSIECLVLLADVYAGTSVQPKA